MNIIESSVIGKKNEIECEDGIVATNDYIAVIDGSTSKTHSHFSPEMKNGRYCMLIISDFINSMPGDITCDKFIEDITTKVASIYAGKTIPEENRLTASAIIFSKTKQEIWMIGDCQCMVDKQMYENSKPYEMMIAQKRIDLIKSGKTPKEAREEIIPLLIKEMRKGQNKQYTVIDGTPIYKKGIKIISVEDKNEIILASDGYPFLKPTLKESEYALFHQLATDPQNIKTFMATKGLLDGNKSFDDRAYIRFLK